MKIAHLIMAHRDIPHIIRLADRLRTFSDVYIHLDINTDGDELFEVFADADNVFFTEERYHCEWGGVTAVKAEIELIRAAQKRNNYDRLIFLQGADYPIKSAEYIVDFFDKNRDVEFIRGCNCTDSNDPYFYRRCRCIHLYNNVNFIKYMYNKICYKLKINIKLRKGYIKDGSKKFKIYWGCAQWALTGKCAEFVVNFYASHKKFNKWFYYAYPTDELYFQTVIMNSPWREKTSHKSPEPEVRELKYYRNLHYFEYPKDVRIFRETDYDFIITLPELYIRKVDTENSEGLLNLIDKKYGYA